MAGHGTLRLGDLARGFRGRIVALDTSGYSGGMTPEEMEKRLLEMGFVEGAPVEIRHQGLFGRDPIAVRVSETTIALRRREARTIVVVTAP